MHLMSESVCSPGVHIDGQRTLRTPSVVTYGKRLALRGCWHFWVSGAPSLSKSVTFSRTCDGRFCTSYGRRRHGHRKRAGLPHASGPDACGNLIGVLIRCRGRPQEVQNVSSRVCTSWRSHGDACQPGDMSSPMSRVKCQTVRGRARLSSSTTTRPLSPPSEAALRWTMLTLIDVDAELDAVLP